MIVDKLGVVWYMFIAWSILDDLTDHVGVLRVYPVLH